MKNLCLSVVLLAGLACAYGAPVRPAEAGLGDSIKKKAEKIAGDKSKEATDKAAEKTGTTDPSTSSSVEGGGASSGGGEKDDGGKVSAVSTKFDFMPGDKVLFADDFTVDPLGEFPSRFKLVDGNVEIAEQGGVRWLRAAGENSKVLMKHGLTALPELWTLEFDYWGADPFYGSFLVVGQDAQENEIWHVEWSQGGGNQIFFRTGSVSSQTPFTEEAQSLAGKHHVSIMARGKGLKIYIDRTRVVNVPEVAGTATDLLLWMRDLRTKPMITNLRFAEGPKPPKDLLAEGKFVTYGIHFATGSDVVQAESAPVLREVSSYMKANPTVKLRITGHTDNVGGASSNLDLSKRRSASVARVLSAEFGVEAERLATDGKGDTDAVSDNKTAEGRAMNRRVEFAKQEEVAKK